MSTDTLTTAEPAAPNASPAPDREKLSKKAITADHPTWCPGCPESFRGSRF